MGIFDKFRKKKARAQKIERAGPIPSTPGKKKDTVPEGVIKVYRNPKGKAFKTLFDFIKKNFYDKEFYVEDLPDVNETFVKEVDQAMNEPKIMGPPGGNGRPKMLFWMGPGADKQAKIEILVEMSKAGVLSYRRVRINEYGDEKVLYKLTEEGKQAKVVFGD